MTPCTPSPGSQSTSCTRPAPPLPPLQAHGFFAHQNLKHQADGSKPLAFLPILRVLPLPRPAPAPLQAHQYLIHQPVKQLSNAQLQAFFDVLQVRPRRLRLSLYHVEHRNSGLCACVLVLSPRV